MYTKHQEFNCATVVYSPHRFAFAQSPTLLWSHPEHSGERVTGNLGRGSAHTSISVTNRYGLRPNYRHDYFKLQHTPQVSVNPTTYSYTPFDGVFQVLPSVYLSRPLLAVAFQSSHCSFLLPTRLSRCARSTIHTNG